MAFCTKNRVRDEASLRSFIAICSPYKEYSSLLSPLFDCMNRIRLTASSMTGALAGPGLVFGTFGDLNNLVLGCCEGRVAGQGVDSCVS